MAAKKKEERPVTHICDICGKVIEGDHVFIRIKRATELHIHYGCMNQRGDKDVRQE